MKELNFYIEDNDLERLFAIKKLQGRDDLTGNEFAAILLEKELRRLFPRIPQFDDNGEITNPESYKG